MFEEREEVARGVGEVFRKKRRRRRKRFREEKKWR